MPLKSYFATPMMRGLLGLGAALYLLTPWLNPGFVALDDYTSLTEFFIPAQSQSVAKIIENSEIRSPLPRLMLYSLSHSLWKLGVEDPFLQYQLVLTFLAVFAYLVFVLLRVPVVRGSPRLPEVGALFYRRFFSLPLSLQPGDDRVLVGAFSPSECDFCRRVPT
ncbi:MAG: hypothetical protein R3B54_14115 [Bdellovibrionota bacterium]